MEKLEKYSLQQIAETLKKCSGIKICILQPSSRMANSVFDWFSSYGESFRYSPRTGLIQTSLNHSTLSVLSGVYLNSIRGTYYDQVFVYKGFHDKDLEQVYASTLHGGSREDSPIFKRGVFLLFDELDEVKRAAAKVISDFSGVLTLFELNVAFENAKKLVQEVAR
jgi:hypothetical protein